MGTEKEKNEQLRESLLRMLADRLQNRGYDELRVSRIEQYEGRRPDLIFWKDTDIGFTPDVGAKKDGVSYIFQVETQQTLQGENARERIALFAAYARHYRRQYCLVVPEEVREEAGALVRNAGADERFVHVVSC